LKEEISVELLENILPHGSGIDSDWEFIEHKNGNVTCMNSFHAMTEHGFYDGYMPFKFNVFRRTDGALSFGKVICNENVRVSFFGLRDYLDETIFWHLSKLVWKGGEKACSISGS